MGHGAQGVMISECRVIIGPTANQGSAEWGNDPRGWLLVGAIVANLGQFKLRWAASGPQYAARQVKRSAS